MANFTRFRVHFMIRSSNFIVLKIVSIVLICLVQWGCITTKNVNQDELGHYYKYKFGYRIDDQLIKKPSLENKYFELTIEPNYTVLKFSFLNKTNAPITILWDSVRFVENNVNSKVFLWGSNFNDRDKPITAATISSGKQYSNEIIPMHFVVHDSTNINSLSKWKIHQMYPDYDENSVENSNIIMSLLGQNLLKLHLQMIIHSKTMNYTINLVPIEIEHVLESPLPKMNKNN